MWSGGLSFWFVWRALLVVSIVVARGSGRRGGAGTRAKGALSLLARLASAGTSGHFHFEPNLRFASPTIILSE